MKTQIKEAMVGKQLTFPDESRIVLLGNRIVWMDEFNSHITPLKIERVKK
jgi:hypothetical protein